MRTHLVLGALLVMVLACHRNQLATDLSTPEQSLAQLLTAVVSDNDNIHGVAMAVDAPGVRWRDGVGLADRGAGIAMTAQTPVRIASNTKTYVAAAILRLFEEGKLDLDDSIAKYLSEEHKALLRQDGYIIEEMRIRHLLTHTSGLFDHTSGEEYGREIMKTPKRHWTPTEQLTLAMKLGEPHGAPGSYTYCDTGYVLLGQIVERVSGENLGRAVRTLLGFDELGLDATWWEIFESKPEGAPARGHQYLGELDCTDFHPSKDLYGGGGLASSVDDMAKFYRALFAGQVFDKPATLKIMLTTVQGAQALPGASRRALPPGAYRMGIWAEQIAGHRSFSHSGFWGTSATYFPELDAVITCTVNQNAAGKAMDSLLAEAVVIVAEAARR